MRRNKMQPYVKRKEPTRPPRPISYLVWIRYGVWPQRLGRECRSRETLPTDVRQQRLHSAYPPSQLCGVVGAHGSASAAPLAFPDTWASPITSASARNASLTPSRVMPEI